MTAPVTAAQVAAALGIPLNERGTRELFDSAIGDAIADVENYLGRAIMPRQYVERGRFEMWNGWNLTPKDEPVREIVSAVPEMAGDPAYPTGYFTVTYLAGLDCTEPDKSPILRYIKAAAMNAPEVVRFWQSRTDQQRQQITNVTTEGQSITYGTVSLGGGGNPGTLAPGALPTLKSLDRWRLAGRRVFIRQGTSRPDWPFSDRGWGP